MNTQKAHETVGPIYSEEVEWLAEAATKATIAIELGSLGGRSSRAIADNLLPNGILYCIDTWAGSKEVPGEIAYAAIDDGDHCYIDFLNATWDLIRSNKIIPLRMHGNQAAKVLANMNVQAELIFIDGGHAKGETKEDITNFLPLLKSGGIICGHDYNIDIWPDVNKEVEEIFGKVINPPNTTIWYTTIERKEMENKKMKYGFDMHGVLSHHEWAREMAKSLLKDGHEVYVISAVDNEAASRAWIASLNIPFTEVCCVHAVSHDDAGHKKAAVMKERGIPMLLDDVPDVIAAVRYDGLIGLHVQ